MAKVKLTVKTRYILSMLDETKISILVALARSKKSLIGSEICCDAEIGKSLLSYHIKGLIRIGWVREVKDGRNRKYNISSQVRNKIDRLFNFLEVKI